MVSLVVQKRRADLIAVRINLEFWVIVTNLLQDPILLGFSFVEGNLSRMLRFGAAKGCTTIDLSQQ